jgi:hypothetical protein
LLILFVIVACMMMLVLAWLIEHYILSDPRDEIDA